MGLDDIWEALVEVEARAGNEAFPIGKRAFVNCVLKAPGLVRANEQLIASLLDLGFRVIELDYLRQVPDFMNGEECKDLIRRLVESFQVKGETQFGPFHAWQDE